MDMGFPVEVVEIRDPVTPSGIADEQTAVEGLLALASPP